MEKTKVGQLMVVFGVLVALYFGYMSFKSRSDAVAAANKALPAGAPAQTLTLTTTEKVYFGGLLALGIGAVLLRSKIVPKV